MTDESGISQRAKEVERDLFDQLSGELRGDDLEGAEVVFHLDTTDRMLNREEARSWIWESVDAGFPNVRYYVERSEPSRVIVNLAAFEDPDSQLYE